MGETQVLTLCRLSVRTTYSRLYARKSVAVDIFKEEGRLASRLSGAMASKTFQLLTTAARENRNPQEMVMGSIVDIVSHYESRNLAWPIRLLSVPSLTTGAAVVPALLDRTRHDLKLQVIETIS